MRFSAWATRFTELVCLSIVVRSDVIESYLPEVNVLLTLLAMSVVSYSAHGGSMLELSYKRRRLFNWVTVMRQVEVYGLCFIFNYLDPAAELTYDLLPGCLK